MDIIRHTLTLVAERLGDRRPDDLADLLNVIDAEVRHEWGGERAYVAKTCERDIIDMTRRNAAIRSAWRGGEPLQLIADRHGISRRMIYKIVRGDG